MWFRLTLLSAAILILPATGLALPYDCPGSDSKAREKYLCSISGKMCPKFMDTFNRIAEQFVTNRDRIIQTISECRALNQSRYEACLDRGRPQRFCDRRFNAGERGCSRRANRGIARIGNPTIGMARTLLRECAKSEHPKAKPCEKEEAAPYCNALRTAYDTYVPIIRDRRKSSEERLAAIEALLRTIGNVLRNRCAAVRAEIASSGFTCKPKGKTCKAGGGAAARLYRSLSFDPFDHGEMCEIPDLDPTPTPWITPTPTPAPTEQPTATPTIGGTG